uniref:Secreted protein n=1 Tax=Arundo donax TaxID=35708 RepID=A0A0A8ZZL7_ARUDO
MPFVFFGLCFACTRILGTLQCSSRTQLNACTWCKIMRSSFPTEKVNAYLCNLLGILFRNLLCSFAAV